MTISEEAVAKPHRRNTVIRAVLIVLVLAAIILLVNIRWPTLGLFLTNQGQIKLDGTITVQVNGIGSPRTYKGSTTLNLPEGNYYLTCDGAGNGPTITSPSDMQGTSVMFFPVERGSSTTFACFTPSLGGI